MGQHQERTLVIPFLYVSILMKGPRWHQTMNNSKIKWRICLPRHEWPVTVSFRSVSLLFYSPTELERLFSACIVLWPLSCEEQKLEGYPGAEYAKEVVNQCIPSSNRTIGHIGFNSLLRKDSLDIGLWSGVPFSDFGMHYIHTWDSWICHFCLWWIEVLPLNARNTYGPVC